MVLRLNKADSLPNLRFFGYAGMINDHRKNLQGFQQKPLHCVVFLHYEHKIQCYLDLGDHSIGTA